MNETVLRARVAAGFDSSAVYSCPLPPPSRKECLKDVEGVAYLLLRTCRLRDHNACYCLKGRLGGLKVRPALH